MGTVPEELHLPCPFCGSDELSDGEWWDDDGEQPTIECDRCKAFAPLETWDRRAGSAEHDDDANEMIDPRGYEAEGADAFHAGVDRSQCPYPERSIEWGAWMYGWCDAYTDVALS